jgi:2-oxoglutarate dehydrogenase E2 component (dihydrolipoamide succinyltransferase)
MADILTPVLGESVAEATIARWTKKTGDAVKKDEVLVELETDKVSLEVSAPSDGTLTEILAGEGDTVVPGTILGRIGGVGEAVAPKAAAPTATPVAPNPAVASPSQATTGSLLDVKTPVMGESVTEGTISKWRKKAGDAVKKDEILVEIETDKVALEVASPADGTLAQIVTGDGVVVAPGQVIARISGDGSAVAQAPVAPMAAPVVPTSAEAPLAASSHLSPAVQRIVSETGLNPSGVSGTGKDGRITKGDALAALSGAVVPTAVVTAPIIATTTTPPREVGPREERVKMTRLRQTIARRLKESQSTAAQLTTFNEVDMSTVMSLRNTYKDAFEKRHGVKLGFMSFFAKAVVAALKDIPAVNAEIEGSDIIYKNHYDLGVAVGTEKGLVVPVLRDIDQLSLAGIEKGIAALGKQARDGTLSLDQLQGGTFTITNGGIYGSLMSTPILNMPQVGILGMHAIKERPVVVAGQIVARPMMYLALSYDHRIVDGKEAVTFLVRIKEGLEDPQRFVLDV